MGQVQIDIYKKAKKYDQDYTMQTQAGVTAFFESIHKIRSDRMSGDIEAAMILIDYEDAVNKAKLSERERQTLYLKYEKDLGDNDVATKMGVKRRSYRSYHERAINKIVKHAHDILEVNIREQS